MPFSPPERVQVRKHLGYPNVGMMASLQFGLPRPIQTAFLVETAMDQLLEGAIDDARRILGVMDGIDCQLIEGQPNLAAEAVGNMKLRADQLDALDREYVRWGYRLADLLGVPVYAGAMRYATAARKGAGSVRVRR